MSDSVSPDDRRLLSRALESEGRRASKVEQKNIRHRTSDGFREALLNAGTFELLDAVYKTSYEDAQELSEKGTILWEYVKRHPDCASRSKWFEATLKLTPHLQASRFVSARGRSDAGGKRRGLGMSSLPRRKRDFSRYLDATDMTEKQRNCASLRWEYELTTSEIARRFEIDRATVRQHIALAQRKINKSQALQKSVRSRAASSPNSPFD
jgi:DNA-binding CsgD family transcriptional regulator